MEVERARRQAEIVRSARQFIRVHFGLAAEEKFGVKGCTDSAFGGGTLWDIAQKIGELDRFEEECSKSNPSSALTPETLGS